MPTLQRLTGYGSGACLPGPRPCLASATPRKRTAKPYSIVITEESARKTTHDAASNTDRVYFPQSERRKVGTVWTNLHYTRDHLGSVREVLDAAGTLLARYDYAPYGERTTRYEASGYEGTDFAFTGHFILPSPVSGQSEILLAHYRAYDPVLGRWLSQDPIRESGGINLYGYVGGRVIDWSDSLGLLPSVVMRYVNDLPKTDAEIRGVVCGASVGPAIIATVVSGPAVVGVRGLIMRNPLNVARVGAALDETGVVAVGAAGAATVTTKLAQGQIPRAEELVSPAVRAFMAGEKTLAELSAHDIARAIQGYRQAADAARSAAHKAYQEARIRALLGEGPPLGKLLDFLKKYNQDECK